MLPDVLMRVTSSAMPGTTAPTHVVVADQLPPATDPIMVAMAGS